MSREKHGTTYGAVSFVAGEHTDAVGFALHLPECSDGRCRERVEDAEHGLSSPVVEKLVTAFLRAQDRRSDGSEDGCPDITDILDGDKDDEELIAHIKECLFCRAIYNAYLASPEQRAEKIRKDAAEQEAEGNDGATDDPSDGEQGQEVGAEAPADGGTGEEAEADATDDSGSSAERGGAQVAAVKGTETEGGSGS